MTDFDTMSRSELRAYVLEHRNDPEAFYRLTDRLKHENQESVWYVPQTQADVDQVQALIKEQIRPIEE